MKKMLLLTALIGANILNASQNYEIKYDHTNVMTSIVDFEGKPPIIDITNATIDNEELIELNNIMISMINIGEESLSHRILMDKLENLEHLAKIPKLTESQRIAEQQQIETLRQQGYEFINMAIAEAGKISPDVRGAITALLYDIISVKNGSIGTVYATSVYVVAEIMYNSIYHSNEIYNIVLYLKQGETCFRLANKLQDVLDLQEQWR